MNSIDSAFRFVQPNGKILEKIFGDMKKRKGTKGNKGLPKCSTDWTLGIRTGLLPSGWSMKPSYCANYRRTQFARRKELFLTPRNYCATDQGMEGNNSVWKTQ
jgi:hypothetical protein